MPPLAATTAKELWEQVNSLAVRVTEYTGLTMEMRQLLKRIEALKNADPGQACLLQASVYQFVGDIDETLDALRKARTMVGPVEFAKTSVTTYMNTGLFSLAQKEARISSNPINGEFSACIKHALMVGLFKTLSNYLDVADKLKLSVDDDMREQIAQANAIVEHYDLSEETIAALLDEVGEVFRANRMIYFAEPMLTIWGFDKFENVEPHISFDFFIDRDVNDVANLREQLATRIAESEAGCYPDGLVVRFSPVSRQRELVAA